MPPADYATQPPQVSGMAITSMILGIVGCLLCIPLAWVALVLGIISLVKINKNPMQFGGKGFAITGIVLGGLGGILIVPALLVFAILMPSLGKARELSNRSVCAANIRGITQSLNVYANDNSDAYPVLPYKPLSTANAGVSAGTGGTTVDDAFKSMYGSSSTVAGSPYAAVWILVLRGDVSPKSFMCKSDPALGAPAAVNSGSDYFTNFQNENQISYSFAYPYNPAGKVGKWWSATIDASLPIMGDMNPKNGTGSPRRDVSALTKASNSGNHQSDGQNIGFGDNHVEFTRLPDCGQDNDNVYTTSGIPSTSKTGRQPTLASPPEIQTDKLPYDVVLVPVRNLDTNSLW
jgi:hypothetical protein